MKRSRTSTREDTQPQPKNFKTSIIGEDTIDLRVPQEERHRRNCIVADLMGAPRSEDFVTYVIWDRHANQLTHLGKRFSNPENIRVYLWNHFKAWLQHVPRSAMTISLPVAPKNRFRREDFDNGIVSVDVDFWKTLLSDMDINRIHVQVDASLHEDDCKCKNCTRSIEPKSGGSINYFSVGENTHLHECNLCYAYYEFEGEDPGICKRCAENLEISGDESE